MKITLTNVTNYGTSFLSFPIFLNLTPVTMVIIVANQLHHLTGLFGLEINFRTYSTVSILWHCHFRTYSTVSILWRCHFLKIRHRTFQETTLSSTKNSSEFFALQTLRKVFGQKEMSQFLRSTSNSDTFLHRTPGCILHREQFLPSPLAASMDI